MSRGRFDDDDHALGALLERAYRLALWLQDSVGGAAPNGKRVDNDPVDNKRLNDEGAWVRLAEQDRSLWNSELIAEGQDIVRWCLQRNQPGPYQLQAAIAAVHADARTAADTDWRQIRTLYDQLMAVSPSPVVALNRAVVVAELDGADRALELVDELRLERYPWWHAVRADLLRRLDRLDDAAAAYRAAIDCGGNARDLEFLERQLRAVRDGQSPSAERGQ